MAGGAGGAGGAGRPRQHPTYEHPEFGHSPDELAHVHATREHPTSFTLTPPHAPRVETELFKATRAAILADDEPCWVCGVRPSDLRDPKRAQDPRINPFGAERIEAHHVKIERSLANAIDRERLAADEPSVLEFATVEAWADSRHNNRAFCDQCHRIAPHAIHSALWPIVVATKYARRDPETGMPYQFAARTELQAERALAADDRIEADVERALDAVAQAATAGRIVAPAEEMKK